MGTAGDSSGRDVGGHVWPAGVSGVIIVVIRVASDRWVGGDGVWGYRVTG